MTKPHVAIIAPAHDAHLGPVRTALEKRGAVVSCFDLADFPRRATLSARLDEHGESSWKRTLECGKQRFVLDDLTAIWNRRRGRLQYVVAPDVIDYARQFAHDEAKHGMDGIWKSSDGCLWLNHPDANRAADSKPYQLHLAKRCGLTVPDSLLTNDPDAVRSFFDECHGQMIYKALNRNVLCTPEGQRYIYTNQVRAEDLVDLSDVRATAHLFQRLVPKRLELRITVIGATIFAAEIYSQHAEKSQIDFRKSYDDLRYGIHALPLSIQEQLLDLMQLLHLEYAAIDMIIQPDGQYVFLELNCSGQYGWIEDETSMPMSETLAAVLVLDAPRITDAVGTRKERA